MKTRLAFLFAVLLAIGQGSWAQDEVKAEPSQTLTEIRKMGDCTVYTFNYPSVGRVHRTLSDSERGLKWS